MGKKSLVPSFLTKLYQILENVDYHVIIRWVDNGKAFVVKNLPEFIDKVLPSYFKHNNFASFVRQLNMYDFHKTRNSNNENTFYHKMFNKGQKNLLKLIKRKVNIHTRRSSLEEDPYGDLPEREARAKPKKGIEDIYASVLRTLEDLARKQTELEAKVDLIEENNSNLVEENNQITEEIDEKKNYTRNLETLILLILEYAAKAKKEECDGQITPKTFLPDERKRIVNKFIIKDGTSLESLAGEEEDKASLLRTLIEEMSENPYTKNLTKNVQLKDFIDKSSRDANCLSFVPGNEMFLELCDTKLSSSVSSPTSFNSECIFAHSLRPCKLNFLSTKRKRTDDSKEGDYESGMVNFTSKNKDSLFEEITRLTPCLISSPPGSPRKNRKNEPRQPIFTSRNQSFNTENFYLYSPEEKGDKIVSNLLINTESRFPL